MVGDPIKEGEVADDPELECVGEEEAEMVGDTLPACVSVTGGDGEGGAETVIMDVSVFERVVVKVARVIWGVAVLDTDALRVEEGAREKEGAGVDEAQLEGPLEAVKAAGVNDPTGVRDAPQKGEGVKGNEGD